MVNDLGRCKKAAHALTSRSPRSERIASIERNASRSVLFQKASPPVSGRSTFAPAYIIVRELPFQSVARTEHQVSRRVTTLIVIVTTCVRPAYSPFSTPTSDHSGAGELNFSTRDDAYPIRVSRSHLRPRPISRNANKSAKLSRFWPTNNFDHRITRRLKGNSTRFFIFNHHFETMKNYTNYPSIVKNPSFARKLMDNLLAKKARKMRV